MYVFSVSISCMRVHVYVLRLFLPFVFLVLVCFQTGVLVLNVNCTGYNDRRHGLTKLGDRKLQFSDKQLQISDSKISIKKYQGLSL